MPTLAVCAQAAVAMSRRGVAAEVPGTACEPIDHLGSAKLVKLATIPGIRLPVREAAISRTR